MKKLSIFLMVLLIGFVAATITLNQPIDNAVSINNTENFNCSSTSTLPINIVNLSWWSNSTGTWTINQTINDYGNISNSTEYLSVSTIPSMDLLWSYQFPELRNITRVQVDIKTNGIGTAWNNLSYYYNDGTSLNITYTISSGTYSTVDYNNSNQGKLVKSIESYNTGSGGGSHGYSKNHIVTATTQKTSYNFTKSISSNIGWGCSVGYDNGTTEFSANRTLLLNVEPKLTINSPSGNIVGTNITFNFTISDDLSSLSYCFYNVTTGVGISVIPNNETNCSNPFEYQTVPVGTGYIVNIFANDTLGQINTSSTTFTVSASAGGGGSSGGGGGGQQPIAEVVTQGFTKGITCTPYKQALLKIWKDTENQDTIIRIKAIWDNWWNFAVCGSAASIVPI